MSAVAAGEGIAVTGGSGPVATVALAAETLAVVRNAFVGPALALHGTEDEDGSWRLRYDAAASNVVMEVRQAGAWTDAMRFTAP